MAKRVTVDHLWALVHAVELAEEFFSCADPDDIQNAPGLQTIKLANESTAWLRREIVRRQNQKAIRAALAAHSAGARGNAE